MTFNLIKEQDRINKFIEIEEEMDEIGKIGSHFLFLQKA